LCFGNLDAFLYVSDLHDGVFVCGSFATPSLRIVDDKSIGEVSMTSISRRSFGGLFGASALGLAMPSLAFGAVPKVVVIGGGAGGATAARYLAKDSKGALDVTLVEASKRYYTCFYSNLYIGGLPQIWVNWS
jgi:spermidine synthase